MLALLHELQGIDFVRQLKLITERHEFSPLDTDPMILTVGGERSKDYPNLLNAARKAVARGYKVYMLPNPKYPRTADFIFERKGVYKMFDLKTISVSPQQEQGYWSLSDKRTMSYLIWQRLMSLVN